MYSFIMSPEVIPLSKTLILQELCTCRPLPIFGYRLPIATDNFSYTNHYEVGEARIINNEKIIVVKGQFTEKIPRRQGGFFLRTVGFINDERSYRLFLLDGTKITINFRRRRKRICCEETKLSLGLSDNLRFYKLGAHPYKWQIWPVLNDKIYYSSIPVHQVQ